jgi:hypothetical protein
VFVNDAVLVRYAAHNDNPETSEVKVVQAEVIKGTIDRSEREAAKDKQDSKCKRNDSN